MIVGRSRVRDGLESLGQVVLIWRSKGFQQEQLSPDCARVGHGQALFRSQRLLEGYVHLEYPWQTQVGKRTQNVRPRRRVGIGVRISRILLHRRGGKIYRRKGQGRGSPDGEVGVIGRGGRGAPPPRGAELVPPRTPRVLV